MRKPKLPPVPTPPTPAQTPIGSVSQTPSFFSTFIAPPNLVSGSLGIRRRADTIRRSLLGGGG